MRVADALATVCACKRLGTLEQAFRSIAGPTDLQRQPFRRSA